MRPPLDDDALADMLLAGERAVPGACPDPSRFWDAAVGVLGPAPMRALLDHAACCPDCSLALRAAREVHAASGLPRESRVGLWDRLTLTVLAPRPALAYLLLLALAGPLAWWSRQGEPAPRPDDVQPAAPAPASPPAHAPVVVLPRVLQLTGDPALRGEAVPSDPPALGDRPVLLRLFLDPEEVPAGATLRVRLSSASSERIELPVATRLEETGSLDVLVDPSQLGTGQVYRLEVLAGERTVFRQSLAR